VKQLGLAAYVFPGGDFSRLSHSLGVCHITGRILEHLRDVDHRVSRPDLRHHRLAALVHDLGHYPFSHAMQDALEKKYPEEEDELVVPIDGSRPASPELAVGRKGTTTKLAAGARQRKQPVKKSHQGVPPESKSKVFHHEELGAYLLDHDPDLRDVLAANKVDVEAVKRIMQGKSPGLGNLVKSDLDADRLDYLLRTSVHTGLPYGSIDLSYLINQVRLDKERRICFTSKAQNAVDHILLGRYFDRMTVAFHKVVVAFELLLEQVLFDVFDARSVAALRSDIERQIAERVWSSVDDGYMVARMRSLASETTDANIAARIQALLNRTAPKLVAQLEYVDDREDDSFADQRNLVEKELPGWIQHSGVSFLRHWVKDFTLTTLASSMPLSGFRKLTAQEFEQSARILQRNGSSIPVMEAKSSLMRVLSDKAYYALRIYALIDPNRPDSTARLRDTLRTSLSARWTRYL